MTSCEIGPVSTPMSLAMQEMTHLFTVVSEGKVRFLCLQSVSRPATEFMHEGHQRDQLRCCLISGLICSVDIIIVLRFAKKSEDHLDYTPISHQP